MINTNASWIFNVTYLKHIIAFNGLLIHEGFLIFEVLLGFNPTPT